MASRLWRPLLITVIFLAPAVATAIGAVGCGGSSSSSSTGSDATSATLTETEGGPGGQEPFPSYNPDFVPGEEEHYSGPFFELSQDYPAEEPPASERPAFFQTDFHTEWKKYMMEVRQYCLEGNKEAAWLGEKNPVRKWYNMPWQDVGESGRESIHGLTREVGVKRHLLAAEQEYSKGGVYAVGFYNAFGGYTIGQVWKDHENPDAAFVSENGFPVGTVVCKPLFVSIPEEVAKKEVPWLTDPLTWQAYVQIENNKKPRTLMNVSLVQMDFMVRDERTSAGWLFGTFQYNGALGHKDRWENLAPVGLIWGNDPENEQDIPVSFPPPDMSSKVLEKTPINEDLKETIINHDETELPATHLGWNGRLNGPADNFYSSCMSCHMTSSEPERPLTPPSSKPPEAGSAEWNERWMRWFGNVGWKNGKLEKFLGAKNSLDFSLQMSQALQNFLSREDGIKPVNRVTRGGH